MHYIYVLIFLSFTLIHSSARNLRAVFFEAPKGAPKHFYAHVGESQIKVDLPKMNFSNIIKLPDGSLQVRFSSLPILGEKPSKDTYYQAAIPETVGDCIALVFALEKAPHFSVQIVPLSADFDKGDTLWINQTNYFIGGKFNGKKLIIPPRKQKILASPIKGDKQYRVEVYYKKPGNHKSQSLRKTLWRNLVQSHQVCFVTQKDKKSLPKLSLLTLFPAPKETPKTN